MIMLITCYIIITIKIFTIIRQNGMEYILHGSKIVIFLKHRTFQKGCSKVNVWQNKAKWVFYPTVSKIYHYKDGINLLINSIKKIYNDTPFMSILTQVCKVKLPPNLTSERLCVQGHRDTQYIQTTAAPSLSCLSSPNNTSSISSCPVT